MDIKIYVPGCDVVMTGECCFYQKRQIGTKVYWKELLPVMVDSLGFAKFYQVQLTGKRAGFSRYFLTVKYNRSEGDETYWALVADFIDRNEMRWFFLNYSLLMIKYTEFGYDLEKSYVWHDMVNSPVYPQYVKVCTGLPAVQVAEDDLDVFDSGCLAYWYQARQYSQTWTEKGCFEMSDFPLDDKQSLLFDEQRLQRSRQIAQAAELILDYLEVYQAKESDMLGSILPLSPHSAEELLIFLWHKFETTLQKLYTECTLYWLAAKVTSRAV